VLDFKKIINNSKLVKEKLKTRNFDVSIIDKILKLSKERSNVMTYLQKLESKKNLISKNIGYKKLKNESIDKDLKNVAKIKEEIEKINSKEKEVNLNIKNKLLYIPNLPNENTPIGKDEKSNVLIKEYFFLGRGKVTNVEAHYEIAKKLDIVDFKRAVKLSGSRYWAYKGLGAKLLRALENYMLDKHIENNYIE
jgi:seryl-tRNA synthetase